MAPANKQLQVSFEQTTAEILALLAEREGKSIDQVVKDLVEDALDRREDLALTELAESRGKDEETISHDDVWK